MLISANSYTLSKLPNWHHLHATCVRHDDRGHLNSMYAWQRLYHQAPLNVLAQLWPLSESLVANAEPLWLVKESPAVPQKKVSKVKYLINNNYNNNYLFFLFVHA